MENASNGNIGVKINNRQITKAKLLMLKLARINYEGCFHLWVSHDGSYSEEGQKILKGNIWQKSFQPGTKAICALLSLPTPSKSVSSSEEKVDNNGSKAAQRTAETISLKKLLLVGQDQSGTSTIFKQAIIWIIAKFWRLNRWHDDYVANIEQNCSNEDG